jgi:hypothetical protein
MYFDKTLRWLEPFGGWGDHSNVFDYIKPEFGMDTGFCNRILHWEVAHYLNEKNDFQYRILLQDVFWPELEILELPYTSPVKMEKFSFGLHYPKEFNHLKFLTVYDIKNMKISMADSLSKSDIEKMDKIGVTKNSDGSFTSIAKTDGPTKEIARDLAIGKAKIQIASALRLESPEFDFEVIDVKFEKGRDNIVCTVMIKARLIR